MAERLTKTEERTKAEGLTLEELEAQVGELLPQRLEMRRRRRRRRGNCNGIANCSGPGSTVTVTF